MPTTYEPPSTLYSVTFTPEPASVAVRFTVTAVACQPDGASSVVAGFALSIVSLTGADVVALPAWSVTTTRSWSPPSGSEVVFRVEPVFVQVEPPFVEYSYATAATPEPSLPFGSPLTEVRLSVPRTKPPAGLGSFIVAVGGVLSTSRSATVLEVAWLPATSTATVRKS